MSSPSLTLFWHCHPERSEAPKAVREVKDLCIPPAAPVPMSPCEHHYYVYIMTNRSKTLYVGMTNNLSRRVWEHKQGTGSEFCKKYKVDRLVYYESFDLVAKAINREKDIKGWLRIKKIQLIVSFNPTWSDLSADWYTRHRFQPTESIGPSLRSG